MKIEQMKDRILSERGKRAMDLCNECIGLLEESTETEAMEVLAALSSAYSSAKAGYVVSGIMAGLGEGYMLGMLAKIDLTETETFNELMMVCSALAEIRNPLDGTTTTIQ